MERFTIPRRTVLRVGGATLALPALEMMRPKKAAAAGGIKRFLHAFTETSVSSAYNVSDWPRPDELTPTQTGANWAQGYAGVGLKYIIDHGLTGEMGLVSGLRMGYAPTGNRIAHNVPGGIPLNEFHSCTIAPQCSGNALFASHSDTAPNNPRAPSPDYILAPILSAPDQLIPVLSIMLSPQAGTRISWKAPAPDAKKDLWGRPLAGGTSALVSPQTLYKTLFGEPGAVAGAPGATDQKWKGQKSVIDVVKFRLDALLKRAGQQDKRILTRYADTVRDLEVRLEKLKTSSSTTKGKVPAPPPEVSSKPIPFKTVPTDMGDVPIYDKVAGYADELKRGQIQAGLLYAAFATDRTRVVAWAGISCPNLFPVCGVESETHAATHDAPSPRKIALGLNWAISNTAQLVKLMSAPEALDPDGSRMIDNTVMCHYFEGGWGHGGVGAEHDQKYAKGFRDPHSVENMVVITAGGKNLGLHLNQHLHLQNDRHPAEVILTCLRALGHTGDFGQMTKIIPEMMRPV